MKQNFVSPFEKTRTYTETIRRIADPRALDTLPMEDGMRRQVSPLGIRFDNGIYLDQHGVLGAYVHRTVFVLRDPENLGSICVYLQKSDSSRSFLCRAFDPDRFGISRKVLAEKMETIQKRMIQLHKEEQRPRNARSRNSPKTKNPQPMQPDLENARS